MSAMQWILLGVLGAILLCVWFARRLRRQKILVLELLGKRPNGAFGLDLVLMSGGELHRGTIYVILSALEDAGLVISWGEDGRRKYRLVAGATQ